MILRCTHRTSYLYKWPAFHSYNELRLMPLTDTNQTCLSFRVRTTPFARVFDYEELGGQVHHFAIRKPHDKLEIFAEATVESHTGNPFEGINLAEPDLDFYLSPAVQDRYSEFLWPSRHVPILGEARELARPLLNESTTAAQFLLYLQARLRDELAYDPDATHVHTRVEEVFAQKAGVCQDFAHAMISCCRSVGIPARYVSGYLFLGTSELRGTQATHAWVEALLPDGNWLSLDPTNNLLANDHYVRMHIGRDYADVAPVRGIYTGVPASSLVVEVSVEEVGPAIHPALV